MLTLGIYSISSPRRPMKRRLIMGLSYALLLLGVVLVIVWSPLARPKRALSDPPMLMQLDPPPRTPVIDPLVYAMSDINWQTHETANGFKLPEVQQIQVDDEPQDNATPVTTQMTYNGRPLRAVKTMRMLVTSYSPDEPSCGKWADGITASGYSVWTNAGKLVAADTHLLPFGTIITVPGYNGSKPVPVLDVGGKIKGHRLDVLYPTHAIARRWGSRTLTITVWEYAD